MGIDQTKPVVIILGSGFSAVAGFGWNSKTWQARPWRHDRSSLPASPNATPAINAVLTGRRRFTSRRSSYLSRHTS